MNVKRLNKLIESLRRPLQPGEKFDMGRWYTESDCGTMACAAGFYILDNPDEGLEIVERTPRCNYRFGVDALRFHFDISQRGARHIFLASNYVHGGDATREDVISHVEDVLNSSVVSYNKGA